MVNEPVTNEQGAQLVLVVPPELASGFRLAGVAVQESNDAAGAANYLKVAMDGGDRGVVGVYAPFLVAMGAVAREHYERSITPIVVPLPSGLEGLEAVSPRARLAALLQRAVGYHITFGDEVR